MSNSDFPPPPGPYSGNPGPSPYSGNPAPDPYSSNPAPAQFTGMPPADQPKKKSTGLIVGGICGCLALLIAAVGLVVLLLWMFSDGGSSSPSTPSPTSSSSSPTTSTPDPTTTTPDPTTTTPDPTTTTSASPGGGDVSAEQERALKKAENYLEFMTFSKEGLYDMLTSEYGDAFPPEVARYAVDNVDADWKENAKKEAQIYYDEMSMSDERIYEQLTSKYGGKYTEEEARYAVDNIQK